MRELRIKVEIVVPLDGHAIMDARTTLHFNDACEALVNGAQARGGAAKLDFRAVSARLRGVGRNVPRIPAEPTPIERAKTSPGAEG